MVKKDYNFANPYQKGLAKAVFKNANVSLKYATEFGRELKGMKLNKAEQLVEDIIAHRKFLPLRKYKHNTGHRKGNSVSFAKTGRYPEKLGMVLLDLLSSVKSN